MSEVVPMVSVVCSTYNNVKFIGETLDAFLAQRANFPIEFLIHDDASTDGTSDIVRAYAKRHPDVIIPIIQPVNVYSQGIKPWLTCFEHARGKYIALCEGDDYWTDPLKLQKQVDFMEAHPGYSMCFHRATALRDGIEEPFPMPSAVDMNEIQFSDLLDHANFIATASVVFRNELMPLPVWFSKLPFGDLGIHFLNSRKGKIKCLGDFMSVYRITSQGAWSGISDLARQQSYLRFFKILRPYLIGPELSIMERKRDLALDKVASAHYPVNPRRKKIYKAYLNLTC